MTGGGWRCLGIGCAKRKVRCGSPASNWVSATAHDRYRRRGILCSIEEAGEVATADVISRL